MYAESVIQDNEVLVRFKEAFVRHPLNACGRDGMRCIRGVMS